MYNESQPTNFLIYNYSLNTYPIKREDRDFTKKCALVHHEITRNLFEIFR